MSISRKRDLQEYLSIIFLDSPKHGNFILARCPQLKFPKVFIQIFIYKIDSTIKVRRHRHQVFSNYY